MTNEQWLVYIYGIYPEGGITGIMTIILIFIGFGYFAALGPGEMTFEKLKKTELHKYAKIFIKVYLVITSIGYFIPDKKTFIALIATPTIVETAKSDTVKDIGNIIELIIQKTKNELEDDINKT